MMREHCLEGKARVGDMVRNACLAVALLLPAACQSSVQVGPQAVAGLTPSGTVSMDEVQVAYIGSGGGGSGTLFYQGQAYPFAVGGLGVGGIGASTISAEGEVYKLNSVAMFPGAYGQARYGLALGNASMGDLWLQNRGWGNHAPKGKALRPDAQPGRGRGRHIDAVSDRRRVLSYRAAAMTTTKRPLLAAIVAVPSLPTAARPGVIAAKEVEETRAHFWFANGHLLSGDVSLTPYFPRYSCASNRL